MEELNTQNKTKVKKYTRQVKKNKRKSNPSNTERAKFDDMNRIEWYPTDPYCD